MTQLLEPEEKHYVCLSKLNLPYLLLTRRSIFFLNANVRSDEILLQILCSKSHNPVVEFVILE